MDEVRNEEERQPKGGADLASDELADKVSAEFTSDQTPTTDLPGEQAEPVMLEEEKVKDEIDIQIDLLKDPDWVVRREAAITLGEMGDERCVEPLCKALYDGDWQVREVAVDALGQIG